jgi:uncharacterized protein
MIWHNHSYGMNKTEGSLKIRYFLALLVVFLTVTAAFSQDSLPQPTGQVNDFAGVMDAATKQQLETRLREFKQKTNPQVEIAVAIVNTTGDKPIFDYSIELARQWKIGSKDGDNPSALLMVAIADRKYYTQVSRDLEDELPDGIVGQIQRQYLVPEFKKSNYSKGIADTIDIYIKTIEAKQAGTAPPVTPPAGTTEPKRSSGRGTSVFSGCGFLFCLIPVAIILLLAFSRFGRRGRRGRDDDRWGGGGGGGVADSVLPWVAGAVIGNILSGSGSSSGGSSSSDWGGSSSGGGSDWGGFGGGGDFGGGGAGGDW